MSSSFVTPWTAAHQAHLSIQEYWSGLPFPSPGDLPYPVSPSWQAESLPLSHLGCPFTLLDLSLIVPVGGSLLILHF